MEGVTVAVVVVVTRLASDTALRSETEMEVGDTVVAVYVTGVLSNTAPGSDIEMEVGDTVVAVVTGILSNMALGSDTEVAVGDTVVAVGDTVLVLTVTTGRHTAHGTDSYTDALKGSESDQLLRTEVHIPDVDTKVM